MAKAKPEITTEQAVKAVKSYMLSGLSTGLTAGKDLEIVQGEPKGKILREFSWDIPIFRKAQGEIKNAVNLLKENNFKIYLTKNF